MSSVRKRASEALTRVLTYGEKPREVRDALARGLALRDRAFLTEALYGALRRRDLLDWMLGRFLAAPEKLRPETRNNLRVGAYQLFWMRVPEWASVDESVRAERKQPGLVNAVLRNLVREKKNIEREMEAMEALAVDSRAPCEERVSAMATLTSHPRWLVSRWAERFGPEEALALCRADNDVPPLTVRVNTLRATRQEAGERLSGRGMKAEPTPLSPVGLTLEPSVPVSELAPFQGLLTIQDEGAQLVTLMLRPRPGERVLDACAAPGGKATHMAELMEDEGEVLAMDTDGERLGLLEEKAGALGLSSIRTKVGDITAAWDLPAFDAVMVDAPCSSLGVIRRNPDVKYRHREEDLRGFGQRQLRILQGAARFVRPGGLLLYATCSTEPEEGEEVAEDFLKSSGDFYIIKDMPFFEGVQALQSRVSAEGFLRTFPHRDGTDAFFAVRLKRRP
jgi:16S rRNA (cytosine967-C5)-methyltransferase